MGQHKPHEDLIKGLLGQLKEIFDSSEQAVYLYLDDHHRACNKKFASLLGYKSPQEWMNQKVSFTELFVDEKSRTDLVSAYHNAMKKLIGSAFHVTWKTRQGKQVK